jgi:hypothetical protein
MKTPPISYVLAEILSTPIDASLSNRQFLESGQILNNLVQYQYLTVYIFDLRANFSEFAFLFCNLFKFFGFGSAQLSWVIAHVLTLHWNVATQGKLMSTCQCNGSKFIPFHQEREYLIEDKAEISRNSANGYSPYPQKKSKFFGEPPDFTILRINPLTGINKKIPAFR